MSWSHSPFHSCSCFTLYSNTPLTLPSSFKHRASTPSSCIEYHEALTLSWDGVEDEPLPVVFDDEDKCSYPNGNRYDHFSFLLPLVPSHDMMIIIVTQIKQKVHYLITVSIKKTYQSIDFLFLNWGNLLFSSSLMLSTI
jgi:hypothetical protein